MILGLAFAARVGVVLGGDFIYHTDVVAQYLEPAWRLVSGYGLVAWEQYYGARSQLIPVALAGVMRAFLALGVDDPTTLRTAVEVVLCGVSLLVPWGVYAFARAVFDEGVGRVALVLCAAWYELVALAGQPLSEMLALCPLLWAFALAADPRTPGRAAALGVLVVLAGALRIQYAPLGMLAAAYALVAMEPSLRARLLKAAAVTLGLVALFDLATVGTPLFRSYFANVVYNLALSEELGRLGEDGRWYFHLLALVVASGGLFAVAVVGMAALLVRRSPSHGPYFLGAVRWLWLPSALTLATCAPMNWQEYRFVLVLVPFWLTAVAVVVRVLWSHPGIVGRTMAALVATGFAAVLSLGIQMRLPAQAALDEWLRIVPLSYLGSRDPRLAFADRLAGDASFSGLAEIEFGPLAGVAHVHLGKPVPVWGYASVVALRACGWEPQDYASHAIVDPGHGVPAGFEVMMRSESGWRLARRVVANNATDANGEPPPALLTPGPVSVTGGWGRTARRVFEPGQGEGAERSWGLRLWDAWQGNGEGWGPLPFFRVHGHGLRAVPTSRVALPPECTGDASLEWGGGR